MIHPFPMKLDILRMEKNLITFCIGIKCINTAYEHNFELFKIMANKIGWTVSNQNPRYTDVVTMGHSIAIIVFSSHRMSEITRIVAFIKPVEKI